MTEIPGKPGCYEDACIDYETPMKYLKQYGYDGYINLNMRDSGISRIAEWKYLPDDVEQVRSIMKCCAFDRGVKVVMKAKLH